MYKKFTIGIVTMLTMVSLSFAGVTGLTVKFTVNMGQQANLGNFTPSTDSVFVRGNMNGWAGESITLDSLYSNDADTLLYSGTFFTGQPDTMTTEGGEDSTFAWKYVLHTPTGDTWEGVSNRELKWDGNFGEVATDTVWFNDDPFKTIQETTVLFSVDMFVQIAVGNFEPDSANQYLGAPGSFNGWSTNADILTPFDDGNSATAIYTTTITQNFGLPQTENYKFFIKGPDGVDNWESPISTEGGNRTFTIDGTEEDIDEDGIPDKILAVVFFNDETADDLLLSPADVTFHVDMNNAVDTNDSTTFEAASNSVYLAGPFNSWLNPGEDGGQDWSYLPEWKMSDDDENGTYEFSHTFPVGTSRNLKFKFGFGVQGGNLDNEAPGGQDHIYEMVGAGPFDTYRVFGEIVVGIEDDNEGPGIVKGYELFQNYPNPFNPTTTIKFNVTKATDINLVIYNTLGQKVRTLFSGHVNAGTVSKVWDGNNDIGNRVSTGIYFYQLRSETGVITKKMTLLK